MTVVDVVEGVEVVVSVVQAATVFVAVVAVVAVVPSTNGGRLWIGADPQRTHTPGFPSEPSGQDGEHRCGRTRPSCLSQ